MNRLIACAIFLLAATSGYTQSFVQLHNYFNTNRSVTATSQGLFWEDPYYPWPVTTPVLINRDFNVAFYGGSDSNSLSLIAIFAGPGAISDNAAGPGTFFDPLGGVYAVPGTTAASTTAFFRIVMWKGVNTVPYIDPTYVQSSVFVNPVGPMTNAPALEGMPAVCLCYTGSLVYTPVITEVYVSGANLFINGTGGAPYRIYHLLSSTNIESSAAWSLVATGAFTGTRSFSITNPINPVIPQSFFRLHVP
jgi:hypothetical protein